MLTWVPYDPHASAKATKSVTITTSHSSTVRLPLVWLVHRRGLCRGAKVAFAASLSKFMKLNCYAPFRTSKYEWQRRFV